MNSDSSRRALLLVVLALFCLLVCHHLLIIGKNGDGVEYAAIAMNLSEGYGTFWKPYLSETHFKVHHEHPPLVYWIQSWFFVVLGDGPYVEGVYGFIIALMLFWGTALFWRRVRKDFNLPQVGAWWPLLLLYSLPQVLYIVQTNRLVVTFLPFAVFSSYFAYRSIADHSKNLIHAVIAGILIYLGLIAKGPVALFPLAIPAIAWVTLKTPITRALISTIVATAACAALFFGTALLVPESLVFWEGFWDKQVYASLTSERSPSRDSYFRYFERLFSQLIVPIGLCLVLMLSARVKKLKFNRQALFFLLVALAGILPFFISTRQQIRYILHGFPFLVLSLAFVTDELALRIESWVEKSRVRSVLRVVTVVFFIAAVGSMIFQKGTVTKREAFYNDVYLKGVELPERITISVYPEQMIHDDLLFTDFMRFYRISVSGEMGHDYLVVDKDAEFEVPGDYERMEQEDPEKYLLFRKAR